MTNQPITVRPVYDGPRSLRGYVWGVFAGSVLTAVTCRYPSKVMSWLVSGSPETSRDPMKYEGRDWRVS